MLFPLQKFMGAFVIALMSPLISPQSFADVIRDNTFTSLQVGRFSSLDKSCRDTCASVRGYSELDRTVGVGREFVYSSVGKAKSRPDNREVYGQNIDQASVPLAQRCLVAMDSSLKLTRERKL